MTAALKQHQLGDDHFGGWIPQRPDMNDREFIPTMGRLDVAQTEYGVDITGVPRINQKQQGSCTGHGTAGLVMVDQKKQGLPIVVPARAMIYYDARLIEGTQDQDSGAMVRDAVAGVVKSGVVPDTEFPYDDQVFDRAPSAQDYADAKKQEALVYEAVAYPHFNQALASGFPVVFGFTVYESFESQEVASTGIVPIPQPGEQILGGHCVWGHGFNSRFKALGNDKFPARTKACRNSWMDEGGAPWGDNGDFYLPQWFFDNGQASDFWVIRRIGQGS